MNMHNITDDRGINFEVRTWKTDRNIPFAEVSVDGIRGTTNLLAGDELKLMSKDGYLMTINFDWEAVDCPLCRRGEFCPDDPKNKRSNILKRLSQRFPWIK